MKFDELPESPNKIQTGSIALSRFCNENGRGNDLYYLVQQQQQSNPNNKSSKNIDAPLKVVVVRVKHLSTRYNSNNYGTIVGPQFFFLL